MKRTPRAVASCLVGSLVACALAGCNQGTYIPLADVPPAPAQDPSLRPKAKMPTGASPSELSYPAPK